MTRKRKACEMADVDWTGGVVGQEPPPEQVTETLWEGRHNQVGEEFVHQPSGEDTLVALTTCLQSPRDTSSQQSTEISSILHECVKDNSEMVDDPDAEPKSHQRGALYSSDNPKKRKAITAEARLKKISLNCEWNMCTTVFTKMERFISHMAEHLATVTGPVSGDGYLCYWRECDFACPSKAEMDRHVYFHAFHAKIKSIGALLMEEGDEQCILDSSGRNMIPEIPEEFQCMWEDCDVKFASAHDFYCHVICHARSVDPINSKKPYHCAWEGCTGAFMVKTRLKEHTRCHTQEKIVGCPNCGGIYTSNTKFFDHCIRQVSLESQHYQCSHCSRRYANERLLRDHVRHHINHYKCPECDMTVPNKSTLAAHVRYRHRKEKPHKCLQCGRGFTAITDLTRHLSVHSVEPAYSCPFQNCSYKCRALSTLNRHIRMVHNGLQKDHYACHVCDSKFSIGDGLTKHLIRIHNFEWPVGHTRFRYKQDEDGFYRLQTVRYESIELNQETMCEEGEEEDVDSPLPSTVSPLPSSTVSSSPASHTGPLTPGGTEHHLLTNDDWGSQDPQRLLNKRQAKDMNGKVVEYQEIILPSEF